MLLWRGSVRKLTVTVPESADFRFACAVGQKNESESYVKNVLAKLNLSSRKYLSEHVQRYKKSSEKRILKSNTSTFKLRRRQLQKQR